MTRGIHVCDGLAARNQPVVLQRPSRPAYSLALRVHFSRVADVRSRDELYPLRMDLVKTLARLSKRRERPVADKRRDNDK